MDQQAVTARLREQDGVIARFQLEQAGARKHDIDRLLRRRDLTRLHPGVYINHTGPPSPQQVEAAAVLHLWPAALGSFSAVGLPAWRRQPHIIVGKQRAGLVAPGIVLTRTERFAASVRVRPFPPRQRIEEATLDAAVRLARPDQMFTFIADVLQSRRTTAARLSHALAQRRRISRRRLLTELLADLETGANSVLEREWLRIERVHGLPIGRRQERFRIAGAAGWRDVVYNGLGLIVELDGRPFHDTAAARDADARRDLLAAGQSLRTIRLTYGQVFGEPCLTALRIAQILNNLGWVGKPRLCPNC